MALMPLAPSAHARARPMPRANSGTAATPHEAANSLSDTASRMTKKSAPAAAEAAGAAAAGADFLVMREAVSDSELAASCGVAAVPLFARGIGLARAWALGASGIN